MRKRKKRKKNVRSRLWHIRTHPVEGYDEDIEADMIDKLNALGEQIKTGKHKYFRGFAWVYENGGEKKRHHFHCAVYSRNPLRMLTVKKYFWNESDLKHTRDEGVGDAGFGYILKKKEFVIEGPYLFGDQPNQGQRTDLMTLKRLIIDGKITNMRQLLRDYDFNLIYMNSLRKVMSEFVIRRDWQMEIIIYYGTSGSAKTYIAKKRYPGAYTSFDRANKSIVWWAGYAGEETVLINEFHCGLFKLEFFNNLLDRGAMPVTCKNGSYSFRSRRIVITTNKDPSRWYSKAKDYITLQRRLNSDGCTIYEFPNKCKYKKDSKGEYKIPVPYGVKIRPKDPYWQIQECDHIDTDLDMIMASPVSNQPEELSGSDSDDIEMKEIPKDQWPIFGKIKPNVIQKDGKTVYLPIDID